MPDLTPIDPIAAARGAEKKKFGKCWDDSFQWDLVSKRVAEVRMQIEDPMTNSSKKIQAWRLAGEVGSQEWYSRKD
jgi:hypothetical protein